MRGTKLGIPILILGVVGALALSTRIAAPEQPQERLFALVFTTGPAWDDTKSPGEQAYMAEHSQNLFRMRDSGAIVLGGRFGPYGLVVVEAADEAAARALLDPDPSIRHGTFQVEIHAWSTIFEGSISSGEPSP